MHYAVANLLTVKKYECTVGAKVGCSGGGVTGPEYLWEWFMDEMTETALLQLLAGNT